MVFTVLLDSHIRRNSEEINNREKSKEKERREENGRENTRNIFNKILN